MGSPAAFDPRLLIERSKNGGVSLLFVDDLGMPVATVVVVYDLFQQVAGALAADLPFPWPGGVPPGSTA